jgi:hypothetical protein
VPFFTKLERASDFEGVCFTLFQRRLKKGTIIGTGQFTGYRVVATKFVATRGKDYSIQGARI